MPLLNPAQEVLGHIDDRSYIIQFPYEGFHFFLCGVFSIQDGCDGGRPTAGLIVVQGYDEQAGLDVPTQESFSFTGCVFGCNLIGLEYWFPFDGLVW